MTPRWLKMGDSRSERILRALHLHPHGLTCRELVEQVYNDPDGGPLYAEMSLSVLVHRLNKHFLIPRGWKITAAPNGGRHARRRLVKL